MCSPSNEDAYNTFLEMSRGDGFAGRRILLKGPAQSGRTHLTVALLNALNQENPRRSMTRLLGRDFWGHIMHDVCEPHRDSINETHQLFLDFLWERDVLVIHDINHINKQLSDGCLCKQILCHLLDNWIDADKLLLLVVDDAAEEQLDDPDILSRLETFEKVTIAPPTKDLFAKWLDRAVEKSTVLMEQDRRDSILATCKNLPHCRYLTLQYYADHKAECFDMSEPKHTSWFVLD